mgnify:CR=1 FL=1
MEKFRKNNAALCGDLIIYHSFEATGLKPSTEYTFTVRAVGKDGKESKDSKAVNYIELIPLLVQSINELNARLTTYEKG